MSGSFRRRAAPAADLAWDEGEVPRSTEFDDVYYCATSGLEESRYVFLEANRLRQRWRDSPGTAFVILETGFGSGLNFLNTWKLWLEQPAPPPLHYISIEKFPLRASQLRRALAPWASLAELSRELQQNYPPPLPGRHRLQLAAGRITLDLLFDDVISALDSSLDDENLQVNAWFLDGFAPSRNPEMWNDVLYRYMSALSARDTSFATFTAAGHVRRGLQKAGFSVEKVPGFGSKRDMSRGSFHGPIPTRPLRITPWHIAAVTGENNKQALVLGAGLAGCSVANSLAHRGWQVTVLDRGDAAGEASGNLQGVLYTRISHQDSHLSSFSLHSYCYALRQYRQMMSAGLLQEGPDGDFCGMLQLQDPPQDHPLRASVASLPELARFLDSTQASQLSGLENCPAGLHFRDAGWLNPPAVCRALLANSNIKLLENCGDLALSAANPGWAVTDERGITRAEAPVAVIACGTHSSSIASLEWLPIQAIRGQVTHLPSPKPLQGLQTVICHEGYIAPARQGTHCLGASFTTEDACDQLRSTDHNSNVRKLEQALGLDLAQHAGAAEHLDGRVGYRCASPDYLPLAGPVPDYTDFLLDYGALRSNARRLISQRGHFRPGLYLSTGHGSRGLTSTPLTAELIASQICGEPAPLDSPMVRALAPARFIVRDLIRNRI